MKKLIIILTLLGAVIAGFSQDSIYVENLSYQNIIPEGNSIWHFDAADSEDEGWLSEATYIQPILRNSTTLYPRSTTYNFKLGGSSSSTTYKLDVTGTGYFSENLYLNNDLYFKNNLASITMMDGEIVFRDNVNGSIRMSSLLSSAIGSARNGLRLLDGYFLLGGNLDMSTSINTYGYSFTIGQTGNYMSFTPTTGRISLYAGDNLLLQSLGDLEVSSDGLNLSAGSLKILSTDYTNTIYDLSASPEGLILDSWQTCWVNILDNYSLDSYITYGMMRDFIEDSSSLGAGTGIGDYVENSSSGKDTIWFPAVVEESPSFDGTDTIDYIPFIIDSRSENIYIATLDITSANIIAGDSLLIVAAPGVGKAIKPIDIQIYLDANTQYTGSNESDVFMYSGGTAYVYYNVHPALFNFATDQVFNEANGSSYISQPSSASDYDMNSPIWLNLGAHATGNGTAKLKFWYTIADFN